MLFVHWLGGPETTNHTEFEPDARALAEAGATRVLVDAKGSRPRWYVLMAGVPTMTEWYLLGKTSPGPAYERRMAAYAPARARPRLRAEAVLFQFADHDKYVAPERADG